MKCIECAHFDLWLYPKMAAHGFGHCKAKGPGAFTAIKLNEACKLADKATEAVIFKRMDWAISRELI